MADRPNTTNSNQQKERKKNAHHQLYSKIAAYKINRNQNTRKKNTNVLIQTCELKHEVVHMD